MLDILLFTLLAAQDPKEPVILECVRWIWSGDVYNRKIVCLEWKIKDCSNRLYPYICKSGT